MNNSLEQLYADHQGKVSDRWSLYLSEYDRLFSAYRDRPIRMLEVGIQNGGSLEIWSKFFPNAERIVGCDINPACAMLEFEDSRVTVVVGDANTEEDKQKILGHSSSFDLIIDDGSHQSDDIVRLFANYFPHLNDDGIYVVEDLHCSYWQQFQGGVFYPYSSIAFFKRLADVVNHEHWGNDKARQAILQTFASEYGADFDDELLGHIHSIEFINSICVIRKMRPTANVLGRRVIAGSIELVASGHLPLHGSPCPRPDQMGNEWSTRNLSIEEELPTRTRQLVGLKRQMRNLLVGSLACFAIAVACYLFTWVPGLLGFGVVGIFFEIAAWMKLSSRKGVGGNEG
jgi:hypothetical protein